jgi:o-succinylbenzoate synthase
MERAPPPSPPLPPLHIVGSALHFYGQPLDQPVGNTQQRWPARHGLILRIWDAAGRQGIGEASPLPGLSPDSLADCAAALHDIHQRLAGVDSDGWPQAPGLVGRPSAEFAFESAVLDLAGRVTGCSAAALLAGRPPWPTVELNALVDSLDAARQARQRGMTTLKLKIGGPDWAAELRLLSSLRQELGGDWQLRLDANGGFAVELARQRLGELLPLSPQLVEQPTRPGQLAGLGRCAVAWAADESLADPAEATQLLHADGCVAWVLKPALLGLRRARQLAVAAQAQRLGVIVTHLFDGPVGLAAASELALSLPAVPWACGLDRHPGLSAWPAVALPHQPDPQQPLLKPHQRAGLGFAQAGLPWS